MSYQQCTCNHLTGFAVVLTTANGPASISQGGIIAIGICVAFVGVAIIVALLVWKYYNNKHKQEAKYSEAAKSQPNLESKPLNDHEALPLSK